MSIGKKISIISILVIILLLYFLGYNYIYSNSSLYLMSFFAVVFSLIIFFFPIIEKIENENASFFLRPFKKIKFIVLNILYLGLLIVLAISIIGLTLHFSVLRKEKFLNSLKTDLAVGEVVEFDTIIGKGTRTPIANINYVINNKIYKFEVKNDKHSYKLEQKIKLKYSLEHPDMFEIIKK